MVNCILQDYQGYMWFGTKDGLNRFDGYSFKIYESNLFENTSISDNHITFLYEDANTNLWVSTRLGGLNLYDRSKDIFIQIQDGIIKENGIIINSISGNQETGLWLSSFSGHVIGLDYVIYRDGRPPEVKVKKLLAKEDLNGGKAGYLLMDNEGIVWLSTYTGLILYDPVLGTMDSIGSDYKTFKMAFSGGKQHKVDVDDLSPFKVNLNSIVHDDMGCIWLVGKYGAYKFNKELCEFELFPMEGVMKTLVILNKDNGQQEVWAGSYFKGITITNTASRQSQNIRYEALAKEGETDFLTTTIAKSRDGSIWIGTSGRGIMYYSPKSTIFKNNLTATYQGKPLNSRSVYSLYPLKGDDEEEIIINSLKYFFHYSPHKKSYFDTTFFSRTVGQDLNGVIWLGSTVGLMKYDPHTRKKSMIDPEAKVISGLYVENDNIWYITPNLLKLYNKRTKQFKTFNLIQDINDIIYQPHESLFGTIQPDIDGKLWIGTVNGLFLFDPVFEKVIELYKNDPHNSRSLNSNEIKSILPDPVNPAEILWIGTPSGLNKLNKKAKTFKHYSTKDGLPNNTVYGILSDNSNNLWLSTNKGLSIFNIESETFINFDISNGLQSNEFNTGAFHKSADGEMFFGGIGGFNRFYPDKIKLPTTEFPIVISDINILGTEKKIYFSKYDPNILKYNFNNISITLSALDYSSPEKLRYAYRIVNKDSSWLELENHRNITLSNLSPGKYVFQARGTDSFGRWGKDQVEVVFVISPPWWNSLLARIFYALIIIGGLYYFWNRHRQQLIQKHQLENEKRQAAAVLDLDKAKSIFLTNITHEFRTPLTTILGLSEDRLPSKKLFNEAEVKKKHHTIHRNGKLLLNLVDQLLELSKLEAGKHTLDLYPGELSSFLSQIVYSFESWAEMRGIKLVHDIDFKGKNYYFDYTKLQQVLTNLMSNAIKFSKVNSTVEVVSRLKHKENETMLEVIVKDQGVGIPKDETEKIFDRFHRVKLTETKQIPGTGIGLALAKELVEFMGGTIRATSELGYGSVFRFEIPMQPVAPGTIIQEHQQMDSLLSENEVPPSAQFSSNGYLIDLPDNDVSCILIVEDNLDVRNYITSCVSEKYNVLTASNGKEGLEMAIQYIPDIIISDVMMPEMDGYTLCDEIKKHPLTSHVPVMLLTAKVDAQSRMEGLRKGADAYLEKPFDREELLMRLENLNLLIQKMQQRFNTIIEDRTDHIDLITLPGSATAHEGPEPGDSFVGEVLAILEENYANEEYSIEQMAQQLYLSRSQMFRKIKSLTGHSPSTFLRTFRLRKAKTLLENQPALSISEIAYATGFSSPKYFSNMYLEEFGKRPK